MVKYYKVCDERKEYKGDRYFKFDTVTGKVVQIVFCNGEIKKGKGNTIGVYLIDKVTFFTNYLAFNYVDETTKGIFQKKFNQVIEILK